MKFSPRDYQTVAINFLLKHPRSALFAQMGLGKTAAVLTAFSSMQLTGEAKRMLVIAPLRVARDVWPEEIKKWDPLKHLTVACVLGSVDKRGYALAAKADVYCINYDNLPWLIRQFKKWPFDVVVADESTKLKGLRLKGGAERAKALRSIAKCTKRWINLTGTPAPQGYMDLWGQSWFLDFGFRLGQSITAYRNRWFKSDYMGYNYELMPHSEKEIQGKLKDICLTLKAKDYFDIDDPIVNKVMVQLPEKCQKDYKTLRKEMYLQLGEGDVEAFNAAALSTKCQQMANGAVFTDNPKWEEVHTAKIEALDSIITEAAGMPVLVAYWFKSDLARLQKAFPKGRVLDNKSQTLKDWNRGKIPLLFAHPKSAGHGLNLQDGGNIIAFFSLTWDLEMHDQIIERIGPVRQKQSGYERPVFVYYIMAEDTVDEAILTRIKTKASVQNALMEAMKK
ncbi:MAG: DEAD/DEAH box helicase [Deltaproteobacteria bacterium]|nr:DEAD/DEAH box helicase [Deltaproteobacteria bacterium]